MNNLLTQLARAVLKSIGLRAVAIVRTALYSVRNATTLGQYFSVRLKQGRLVG